MAGNAWTAQEVERLRELADTTSSRIASETLGRSLRAVRNKAFKMGIVFRVKEYEDGIRKRWTKKEETMLMGYAEHLSAEATARRLERSCASVKAKAKVMGISFKQGRLLLKEVGEILGVSDKVVAARRDKLGLRFRCGAHGRFSAMRGPSGKDIAAIAQDMLDDPSLGHQPKLSARELRQVVIDYSNWEG